MKEIVTSCYAMAERLKAEGYELVAVSRGIPKGMSGLTILSNLAPTWKMLKMKAEDYNVEYQKILDSQNANEVFEALPQKCALLCYEKYPAWCHRRMLAEWIEEKVGVVVTEFGMEREDVMPYDDMCYGRNKKQQETLF